jgi:hypothetical protein
LLGVADQFGFRAERYQILDLLQRMVSSMLCG